ncbi:histidine kinase, partial [Pseudomonas putida]
PANLLLLEKQLNTLGHRVTVAENGQTALALWQAERFDLVITDCSMPVMDGHQLARSIRLQEHELALPACTILGITANAQTQEHERCLASGMDDCLFKPVGLSALKAHLPQGQATSITRQPKVSGFNLNELHHLTQNDDQLVRRLLHQLSQSSSEDLAALRGLGSEPDDDAVRAVVHRIKGGAKMLKVRGLVKDCEAIEQAQARGVPTDALRLQLETSLQTLQRELSDALSVIAVSN